MLAMVWLMLPGALWAQQYLMVDNFNGSAAYPPDKAGWVVKNNSSPNGQDWFQGQTAVFSALSGSSTSYYAANFSSTGTVGTISNWLLTPEMDLVNGNVFSFYTRCPANSTFADRLQVYLSTSGPGTNVDTIANAVGTFSYLLLEINPSLASPGYPAAWTGYSITIGGLPTSTTGRIGFRYFVTAGGANGINSNYIGIDSVSYYGIGQAVGLASSPAAPQVNVFPNPFTNQVTINGCEGEMELYDVQGKTVLRKAFRQNQAVDVSGLNEGIYLLRLFDSDKNLIGSYRLVKNN